MRGVWIRLGLARPAPEIPVEPGIHEEILGKGRMGREGEKG
jgi:hypothetical protein